MHSKYTNQQEKAAVTEFMRNGSIRATIQKLEYPSPATLYRWYEHQKAGITNWHGPIGSREECSGKIHSCNNPGHSRHPSADIKMDALHRCFELGEDAEYVSRDIGYSRCSIYKWRRLYLEKGGTGLMSSKKNIKRKPLVQNPIPEPLPLEVSINVQKQINKL